MVLKHYNILVKGKIQNVGFTFQVMKLAEELDICGYATYIDEDTVKIEVEGKPSDLTAFINWIKYDTPEANISDIEIKTDKIKGFSDFTIANIEQYNKK